MAWAVAKQWLRSFLPKRLTVFRQLDRVLANQTFRLLLKNSIRRKIVKQLLLNGNEWGSISTLANEIGENKATVQDHLETLAREGLLIERRFMNKRLFKLRPEYYASYTPNYAFLAELSIIALLVAVHIWQQTDLTAGLAIGGILVLIIRMLIETSAS